MFKNSILLKRVNLIFIIIFLISISIIYKPINVDALVLDNPYTHKIYDEFNINSITLSSNGAKTSYSISRDDKLYNSTHTLYIQNMKNDDKVDVTLGKEYSDETFSGKVAEVKVQAGNNYSLVANTVADCTTNIYYDKTLIKASYKPLSSRYNFGIYCGFINSNNVLNWTYLLNFRDGKLYANDYSDVLIPFTVSEDNWYNVAILISHDTKTISYNINGVCSTFSMDTIFNKTEVTSNDKVYSIRPLYCRCIYGTNTNYICSNFSIQDINNSSSSKFRELDDNGLIHNVYGKLFYRYSIMSMDDSNIIYGISGMKLSSLIESVYELSSDKFYKIIIIPKGSSEPIEDLLYKIRPGDVIYFYSTKSIGYVVSNLLNYVDELHINNNESCDFNVYNTVQYFKECKYVFIVKTSHNDIKYTYVGDIIKSTSVGSEFKRQYSIPINNITIDKSDIINIFIISDFINISPMSNARIQHYE